MSIKENGSRFLNKKTYHRGKKTVFSYNTEKK